MSNEYVENSIYNFKDFWVLPFINLITTMSQEDNYKLSQREVIDLLFNNGNLNEQLYIEFNKNDCKSIPCLYAIPYKQESDLSNKNDEKCSFEAPDGPLGLCYFCPLAVINIYPNSCLSGYLDEVETYTTLLKNNNLSKINFLKYKKSRFDTLQLIKKIPYSQHYLNNSKPTQGF